MTSKIHTAKSLSVEEIKTRELFSTVDWSSTNQAIANVFIAHSIWAITPEQIAAVTKAVHLIDLDEEQLKKSLRKLVRDKVLRSRKLKGVTHYEVNYK